MSGQRISDAEIDKVLGGRGYPFPSDGLPDITRCALNACHDLRACRAEIARLTDKVQNLVTLLDQQVGTPCEQIRHQQTIEELADLQFRYNALLAERAGVSEAIQRACDLLAERTYGNVARSASHNARLVLEAALATPIPVPVDCEAIRADALEEAAKIADYYAKGNRDVIANASATYKIVYRECAEDCEEIASAIRSASKTEGSR